MNHNCDQCDGKYDCGYGNPCSSHGEQIWCSKECQEEWFGEIFQVNMKVGLKNE